MKTKRLIAMLLVIVMLMQTVSFALTPSSFDDFPSKGHWSYDAMVAALDNGLLQGKGGGIIAPQDNLQRAEFAAVVTRAFGAIQTQDISMLTDVNEDDWFYQDNSISKAYKMGVMNGTSSTTFSPKDSMRREDVFLTLARALFVSGTDEEVLKKFEDRAKVDSWAKEAIIGMVDEGYVNGYHNEETDEWTLQPRDSITREELAQVFHNLFKYYISDYDVTEENKGRFGGKSEAEPLVFDGSVMVRTPGVTLENVVINGDLVIADGVGDGTFLIKNSHVTGHIIVRGGESASKEIRNVEFDNVTVDENVIINNLNGTVHFNNYRTDKAFVGTLVENTPATFLEKSGDGTGSGSGGGGGGGSTNLRYPYTIMRFLEPVDEGVGYDDYERTTDVTGEARVGKKVYPLTEAGDIHGFELDTDHPNYDKYADGVKLLSRNPKYSVYYTRKSFKVSFDAKAVDGNDIPEFDARYESVLDSLPAEVYPEEGKTFIGWSTEDDGTVDDEIKVLDDTVLYPVYTYEVTFVDPDGNPAGSPMTNVAHGHVITEQDIIDAGITDPDEVPGMKYVGWSTTPDNSSGDLVDSLVDVVITGPVTYYQILVEKDKVEYRVEHRLETVDGSAYVVDEDVAATQIFMERPDLTVTATPLTGIEGFVYFAHPDQILFGTVLEDGSLLLVLYYNRLTYDVVFKDEDGNEVKTVEDVKFGATVDDSEIPSDDDMKVPGKNFEGWSTEPDGEADDVVDLDDVTIDEDTTTFYPVYTDKDPVDYTVEYYFEELDGSYVLDSTFTYVDSAVPDFEVTADELAADEIPVGFELYVDHPDAVPSEILPDDGTTLKLYYRRLTYTVKFDGFGEYEYKYGQNIDEDDIPEDDEVTVPAGQQFMGWSTTEGDTAGKSKDELKEEIVTGDVIYYPAFAELGAVVYKIYHHFEALDGSYDADITTVTESAKPATNVEAEIFTGDDLPEGFEYFSYVGHEVLTGTVPSDGTELKLHVYYRRLTYTVEFDGFGEYEYKYGQNIDEDDIPEDDEVTVPAGQQFMGWSTTEGDTAGKSKDELKEEIVTGDVTYYPAFAELGAVEYKIYHHFESLDGSYDADITTVTESAKPATNVEAEIFTGDDLPEGFEYFDHDDGVLEGTVPSDGSTLELHVYYRRLTYTVKFDTVSEETYKYGYKLTDSDIPQDDEVPVEDHERFVGWATEADAETGVDRDELVDVEVTENLVYYPVIVDKDAVIYYVEHYFEDLELDEHGNPTYSLYETTELYGKIGTSVVAEEIEVEGFTKITHDNQILSGQIPKEPDVLTLKIYYARETVDVNFYNPAGNYYDSDTKTYSQPNVVVEVRYGTKPDDEENLDKFRAVVHSESDRYGAITYTFEFDRGYVEGFWKIPEFGSVYTEDFTYLIPLYWWYEDAESGEFEKFYQEGVESTLVFTSDVDVYAKAKKISVVIEAPQIDYPAVYEVLYDDDTRFLDTVKNAIFVNAELVEFDLEYSGIEDKVYEKFTDKGVFDKVGDKYEISNFNRLIRFARLMGEEGFEDFLESFIDDSAVTSLEDFLFDYILTHDIDETAEHLKELVDDLIVGHEDIARDMMHDLAVDIIEKEITHVEEFFMTYTTSLVEADDTDDLEKMICEMFTEYKRTNETEFVAFVTDVVVKALSEDTPNADVVEIIEDYIKSEIKKGTYNDEIINYIMGMTDAEFKSAATSVIKEDVSIIETDVKEKILTDNDFVETIIDEIFALDSETVDNEIKEYINDYNLADDYIKDNPEVIVDYITDEQIAEFYGGYIPGVTLTRLEKIDAVTQFIADDPDAVSKLKNYAGASNIKTLIGDYYGDNKDTVKEEMKTEVVANLPLRTELADFALTLINNDEFSDLLDFAIDDYLGDVLADDSKKLALAQQEVDRLSNDKVYNLDFVQDAIDTVIDDVIDDIKTNETDGDPSTESEYVADIKTYVKSVTDFSDIVDSFVHADEEFRNEIIVNLFDDLYLIDSDHTIILQFMEKVTNKMIDEGDIDINILITVIEYIRDMGEHGHTLTRDIINNLMELDDELVDYVENNLGWIDNSGRLEASLKFKKEATYEEKFEVTLLNDEFIMDKVAEKVEAMTFDAFMEEYVYAKLPENVSRSMVEKLPLHIIEDIYERSHDDFMTSLEQARENVKNGMTDQWVYSGFYVNINPITDVVAPMHEYAMNGYDAAIAKAETIGGRGGKIYTTLYKNNPYIEDIIALFDMDYDTYENNFFEGTPKSCYEPSSGFYIRRLSDIYKDVLMPGSVLADDMFVWFLNPDNSGVEFSTIRGFAEDNEDLILAMYNHPNVLMERYAEEGLPESIEQYYHDLMEDPDIKDAFMKVDNKVSFEMEPFFLRFLTNETIEMYYYKGLEKFGMRADVILDKYEGAEVKKEITHENFVDMLDEIEYCWLNDNKDATTDYVFDGGLKNLFSIVYFEKGLKGYTVTVERGLEDR